MHTKAIAVASMIATLAFASPANAGCAAIDSATYDMGTRTTGQAARGTSRGYDAPAGLGCTGVLLSLLSSNRIEARVRSRNGFRLVSASGRSMSYVASPLPDGSRPIAQDGIVNYSDPTLLSLLTLDGRSTFDLPISFLGFQGSGLSEGRYIDEILVDWNWSVCDGISLLNLVCLLHSRGTARTTISIETTIVDRSPTMEISLRTISDPVNRAVDSNPKAIPGSIVMTTVTVQNPDVVDLDRDGIVIVLPIARDVRPDVSHADAVSLIQGRDLSLSYSGSESPSDDVDFLCRGDWSCVPADGSEVEMIRARIRGVLKAGASLVLNLRQVVN